MKTTQQTIGIREAARLLNFTTMYVYDLVHRGKLPAEKQDGQWKIPVKAVEARLEQRGA